jgi:hypothetical protein
MALSKAAVAFGTPLVANFCHPLGQRTASEAASQNRRDKARAKNPDHAAPLNWGNSDRCFVANGGPDSEVPASACRSSCD